MSYYFVEVVQITDKVNLLFLFQIVLIYMTTQNVVNLNQSYFPMYLTDTLHFEKVKKFSFVSLRSFSSYVCCFCNRSNLVLCCFFVKRKPLLTSR